MSLVEVAPDVRLHVEEYGHGDPVVLIHGGLTTHAMWDHQVAALSSEFRIVTYDLQGIGHSDRGPGEYSVDTFAQDLGNLLIALDISGAVVVGYALGAHVALRLAATAQQSVGKLVLVSGAPWFVSPQGGGGLPPDLWALMQSRAAIDRAQADLALIDHDLFHHAPSEGMRLWCAQMAFTWPLPVFKTLAATLAEVDHTLALEGIDIPTLVVHGRHDRKTPHEGGVFLAEHIRGARLVTMEDCGHCPPLEQVEDFNSILLDFVRAPT